RPLPDFFPLSLHDALPIWADIFGPTIGGHRAPNLVEAQLGERWGRARRVSEGWLHPSLTRRALCQRAAHQRQGGLMVGMGLVGIDRKSTRLNSSHVSISYA